MLAKRPEENVCTSFDATIYSHTPLAMSDGEEAAVNPLEFKNTLKGYGRLLARPVRRNVSAEGSLVGMEEIGLHYSPGHIPKRGSSYFR